MRQHNFVFDVDNLKLGIARATCSLDPNQVKTEQELILAHQRFALDPTHTESANLEVCEHNISGVVQRPPRIKHSADPQPKYLPPEKVDIGF